MIQKHKGEPISTIVSSIDPFGFPTSKRGSKKDFKDSVKIISSDGIGFVHYNDINQGLDLVGKYKVIVSQTTSEHAGEPNKDGKYKLLATVKILSPKEICTFSYIVIGGFDIKSKAQNLKSYLLTKFARFLILQAISSIHISREKFLFLPIQDFSEPWTDTKLYKKYGITEEEIAFIDSLIRPMELVNG